MPVSLSKGGNVSLTRTEPSLKHILIGLGWDPRGTLEFDFDASLFLLAEDDKVRQETDFIFYNNLRSTCGSVQHTGDNRTGAGDSDDEAIRINLDTVPSSVKRMVVCVTIHDANARKQNFGQVGEAFMRIVNLDNGAEIARFDLSEDYSTDTAMIFGEVYRHKGEWKFKAVGQGFAGGLESLCGHFGVGVK